MLFSADGMNEGRNLGHARGTGDRLVARPILGHLDPECLVNIDDLRVLRHLRHAFYVIARMRTCFGKGYDPLVEAQGVDPTDHEPVRRR